MVREKGTHTIEIYLEYHRCPHCGLIMENRQGYEKRRDHKVKELTCKRCEKEFSVVKKEAPTLGPLLS